MNTTTPPAKHLKAWPFICVSILLALVSLWAVNRAYESDLELQAARKNMSSLAFKASYAEGKLSVRNAQITSLEREVTDLKAALHAIADAGGCQDWPIPAAGESEFFYVAKSLPATSEGLMPPSHSYHLVFNLKTKKTAAYRNKDEAMKEEGFIYEVRGVGSGVVVCEKHKDEAMLPLLKVFDIKMRLGLVTDRK